MDEEQRTKAGIMPLNRPNDRPRPPANAAATVYVNNVSLVDSIIITFSLYS